MQRGLQAPIWAYPERNPDGPARGERLSELQSLLPEVDASGKRPLPRSICRPRACGCRFSQGHWAFGYTDVRASLNWSLVDVASLHNYLAARHNFAAAQLSAEDARDLVVLTVGNAYLLVLADEAQ